MPMITPAGGTVRFNFTTRNSSGVPTVLAGTPVVSIFKDDVTSPSTTGVTLTASFASVVGLNHVAIDTSADGTFYAAGHHFEAVITTGTVGGSSVVGEVVLPGGFDLGIQQVQLADAVAHGGTLGSSTATLALSAIQVTRTSGKAVVYSSGDNVAFECDPGGGKPGIVPGSLGIGL